MKQFSLFLLILCLFAACNQKPQETKSLKADVNAAPEVDIEEKLKEMDVSLIKLSPPIANFSRAVRSGNLVFLAGHGPEKADGTYVTGKVGKDITIEEAQEAAKITGIALLSALKEEIGDLNKVKKIVKVHGMVNAVTDFTEQPKVMNGFSDFIVELYGKERGMHARAAVGMGSLPNNIPVEIEMIVEVED